MKKEDWIKHIEAEGITAPSKGGDMAKWREVVNRHHANGCSHCVARSLARKAEMKKKGKFKKDAQFYKDLGMSRNIDGTYESLAKRLIDQLDEMFTAGGDVGIKCPECGSTDVACYVDKCTCKKCDKTFTKEDK
jgi:hypothetical protein